MTKIRKVGNFVCPEDNEEDWLEPDTVKDVILEPIIARAFRNKQTDADDSATWTISFFLDNIDSEEVITMYAETIFDGITISSDIVKEDELVFANDIAQNIYQDKDLEETNTIVRMKVQSFESLSKKILAEYGMLLLLEDFPIRGIGFINHKGKRIASFETLEITTNEEHVKDDSAAKTVLQIKEGITFSNLEEIETELEFLFYLIPDGEGKGYALFIPSFKVCHGTVGALKSFILSAETKNIEFFATDLPDNINEVLLKEPVDLTKLDEEQTDEFITSRKELMGVFDEQEDEEDYIDSHFKDIL